MPELWSSVAALEFLSVTYPFSKPLDNYHVHEETTADATKPVLTVLPAVENISEVWTFYLRVSHAYGTAVWEDRTDFIVISNPWQNTS